MKRQRELVNFNFDEPSSQTGTFPPISLVVPPPGAQPTEFELASFILREIKPDDRIRLTATVGWRRSDGDQPVLEFRIRRGGIVGPIVFSTRDTGFVSSAPSDNTTSFDHVETGVAHSRLQYTLTVVFVRIASFVDPGTIVAVIDGPVHFDGEVIDDNGRKENF
ncbi:hypothetical protein [Brevibacillus massiliensis]|uniref:hypothetical protein n=1 Tax=Brevibacillus massiliensis TaxID=1118054 RepID=UPI000314B7DA|nr:hypothetical protein [Brevibacillus massiliensis]